MPVQNIDLTVTQVGGAGFIVMQGDGSFSYDRTLVAQAQSSIGIWDSIGFGGVLGSGAVVRAAGTASVGLKLTGYADILNRGLIEATGLGSNAIQMNPWAQSAGTRGLKLANYGQVKATGESSIAILGSTRIDEIQNFGLIQGEIYLDEGNDLFQNKQGATLATPSKVYMGTGDDEFVNQGQAFYIYMDEGNDLYRALGGGVANRVYLGDGDDQAYLGSAGGTVDGDAGNDTIVAGSGIDKVYGGDGFDTVSYAASSIAVTVDLWAAWNNTGDAQGDEYSWLEGVVGTAFADDIRGTGFANRLDGGAGADRLAGGLGADVYVVDNGDDVVIETSNGTDPAQEVDLIETHVSYVAPQFVENMTAKGSNSIDLTGNGLSNVLTGNVGRNYLTGEAGKDTLVGGGNNDTLEGGDESDSLDGGDGADSLDGGAGADTMIGGAGNDIFIVDNAGDVITEDQNGGSDELRTSVSYVLADTAVVETMRATQGAGAISLTGNAHGNQIIGNEANNTLDGGAGVDVLTGGGGNDTYVIDNAADVIVEDQNGGSADELVTSINYILSDTVFIEVLRAAQGTGALELKGNSFANKMFGNESNNKLWGGDGNDTIDGGVGADTMTGGAGDDTYFVDNAGDVIVEDTNGGNDTIVWVGDSPYQLPPVQNVETQPSSNTGGGTPVNGGGTNPGGGGTDPNGGGSTPGSWNPTIVVGNPNGGTVIGNSLDNTIIGSKGKDVLDGAAGNDVIYGKQSSDRLVGGSGKDTFVFDVKGDRKKNLDKITDFSSADDSIWIENKLVSKIGKGTLSKPGELKKSFFRIGKEAKDKNDYVIYDKAKGVLYYDPDGSGEKAAIAFATVKAKTKLSAADFFVI